MTKRDLLALMVYAVDTDSLSLPVHVVLDRFQTTAERLQKNYTDPSDTQLFCRNVVNMKPVDFFTDYLLCYAKMDIQGGYRGYGKLNQQIINS